MKVQLSKSRPDRSKWKKLYKLDLDRSGRLCPDFLFFGCLWVDATSQFALANSNGVYPTVKDAVMAVNSKGWGGAHVTSIENIHTGPNSFDGSHPHREKQA